MNKHKSYNPVILLLFLFFIPVLAMAKPVNGIAGLAGSYTQKAGPESLCFTENKGQLRDQYGNPGMIFSFQCRVMASIYL